MKNQILNLILPLILVINNLSAQGTWSTTSAPTVDFRYDDIYFLNPDTGWAISLWDSWSQIQQGTVLKTTDGGVSWQKLVDSSKAVFRDVGFLNSQIGFIGTLESGGTPQDTAILYKTNDGGTTWNIVLNLPGPRPAGICGMHVVNDSTIYACGRYPGPSGFYKTTDYGNTWSYINMNPYAGGLVDIFFFDPDTGFVVGTNGVIPDSSGIILSTTDGGNSWQVNHITTRLKEWCWKISFPSRNIGYVSLQSARNDNNPQFFLKTIDGGVSWQELPFTSGNQLFNCEGIGFINDTMGWIGGGDASLIKNYKTIDGGITWTPDNFGNTINRFRFLSDTLGYASGEGIYKFNFSSTGISEHHSNSVKISVYPNPLLSELVINGTTEEGLIELHSIVGSTILQTNGREKQTIIDTGKLTPGVYLINYKEDKETVKFKVLKF